MFCPKCGSQNVEQIKFCRNCGADLSNVLAVVEGRTPEIAAKSSEYSDAYSSGIRNIVLGFGFALIAFLLFTIPGDTFFWLFMLFPAIILLATGISRVVKAEAMTKNFAPPISLPPSQSNATLPPMQTEYIKPQKSIYKTEDLAAQPPSVTEPTTRQLEMNSEGETVNLPKN